MVESGKIVPLEKVSVSLGKQCYYCNKEEFIEKLCRAVDYKPIENIIRELSKESTEVFDITVILGTFSQAIYDGVRFVNFTNENKVDPRIRTLFK